MIQVLFYLFVAVCFVSFMVALATFGGDRRKLFCGSAWLTIASFLISLTLAFVSLNP